MNAGGPSESPRKSAQERLKSGKIVGKSSILAVHASIMSVVHRRGRVKRRALWSRAILVGSDTASAVARSNMLRRFKFEDEVHQSLSCVPMAVRRKLDQAGVKISLEQWQTLRRGERLAICHLPTESDEERATLKFFVEEAVQERSAPQPSRSPTNCGARRNHRPPRLERWSPARRPRGSS